MRLVTALPAGGTSGFVLAVSVIDGRVHVEPRAPLHRTGTAWSVALPELRAAIEAEAFDNGVVIPPGPGAKVGRRKIA